MHTHVYEQVHRCLQPHFEYVQSLTVDYPQADLMRWHYRLGHLYFYLINAMVEVVLLPKNLSKDPIHNCAGCMFAAMIKKPWNYKWENTGGQFGLIIKITRPGKCISFDILESPQVGFITHMKGRIVKKRYRYATVFVDHLSDLKYVHCISEIKLEENIYAKKFLRDIQRTST